MILMMNGLGGIIERLEAQKSAIEEALAALRDVGGGEAPSVSTPVSEFDRRSAAQKKRWAEKRAAAQAKKRPGRPKKLT